MFPKKIPYNIPKHLWLEMVINFMHLKRNNYLYIVDYNSKFIEVWKVTHKTAKAVISALKHTFRNHGKAKCLYADNGSPFASHKSQSFI